MKWNNVWKEKRFRDILLLCAVGAALVIACYFVFFKDGEGNKRAENVSSAVEMTAEESKLCAVLSEIEGVGKINAYINANEEGEAAGAILIFEGADSLSVRMDVLDAASLALGIDKKNILIYKLTKE